MMLVPQAWNVSSYRCFVHHFLDVPIWWVLIMVMAYVQYYLYMWLHARAASGRDDRGPIYYTAGRWSETTGHFLLSPVATGGC